MVSILVHKIGKSTYFILIYLSRILQANVSLANFGYPICRLWNYIWYLRFYWLLSRNWQWVTVVSHDLWMSSRAFPIWIKNVDGRNGFNFGSQDRKIHLLKKKTPGPSQIMGYNCHSLSISIGVPGEKYTDLPQISDTHYRKCCIEYTSPWTIFGQKKSVLIGGRSVYFSPDTPITSNNKTTCHDIAELLLKVTLNIISLAYIYLQLHLIDVQ
jgi:hypothetical protein